MTAQGMGSYLHGVHVVCMCRFGQVESRDWLWNVTQTLFLENPLEILWPTCQDSRTSRPCGTRYITSCLNPTQYDSCTLPCQFSSGPQLKDFNTTILTSCCTATCSNAQLLLLDGPCKTAASRLTKCVLVSSEHPALHSACNMTMCCVLLAQPSQWSCNCMQVSLRLTSCNMTFQLIQNAAGIEGWNRWSGTIWFEWSSHTLLTKFSCFLLVAGQTLVSWPIN